MPRPQLPKRFLTPTLIRKKYINKIDRNKKKEYKHIIKDLKHNEKDYKKYLKQNQIMIIPESYQKNPFGLAKGRFSKYSFLN